MSFIEFSNVVFYYNNDEEAQNNRPAIDGVSFCVEKGEVVAVIGHNGSGKSTLAKLCNGLLEPDEGEILVDGISTKDKKRIFDIRSKVGIVFQNPDNQMVATIIEDDVAFGPENLGLKSEEIRQRVDWALKSVGMSEHAKGTPFKLSGGQKQRIAIAGVLALKPQVMILDESTAMLDPLSRKEIMDVAMKLVREENMTLINITHFVDEAMEADKIIVLNDGKIFMQGGKEVLTKYAELASIGLEAPLAVRVKNKLNEQGYDLPTVLTDEELVDCLCR
ncbi:MAG: energy-coupling factor transporter ATPase [Clostridiales bacterium]|nr:energy-coupling factor transporter ATPase [Clostridiales bacterium]